MYKYLSRLFIAREGAWAWQPIPAESTICTQKYMGIDRQAHNIRLAVSCHLNRKTLSLPLSSVRLSYSYLEIQATVAGIAQDSTGWGQRPGVVVT